jgi:hypothetical protein
VNTESNYSKLAEAQVEEWRAQSDKLKAQAKRTDAKTQIEVHKAIDRVEQRYDLAKSALSGTADSLNDALKDLESGVQQAWDEMKQSAESAAERFSKSQAGE